MGRLGAAQAPRFVVSVGDNFYESGLTSTEDDQFASSFSDIYTHPSLQAGTSRLVSGRPAMPTGCLTSDLLIVSWLQVPWYNVLGNHDYGEVGSDFWQCMAVPRFVRASRASC